MAQCVINAVTQEAKQKRYARNQQEDRATALGRPQGGRNERLASRISVGKLIALVRLATQIAIGARLTCDVHNSSALGAELAFIGKYYITSANLALVACNLHEAAFRTVRMSHEEERVNAVRIRNTPERAPPHWLNPFGEMCAASEPAGKPHASISM
jgi:hypothetical protein